MLLEVDAATYYKFFPVNPHSFISDPFINLNKSKTEKIIYLIANPEKPSVGLVTGMKNRILLSHFSAPFGGFHFRNEIVYISDLDFFLKSLNNYMVENDLSGIDIVLPPDIYHQTFNSKISSSLLRNEFHANVPEITNWVDLHRFSGEFSQKNSREYYRQALRNNLVFEKAEDLNDKIKIYNLIKSNREKFGRPIYMSFDDVIQTGNLWPVDFFKVSVSNSLVASAIFYRNHSEIVYATFWGDNEEGRPLRAMDFLSYNLWQYYKNQGFHYIDLGISTESGIPNEGLLRFKESHDAVSSLKYKFSRRINPK
ncbi:MAG TPA: hypothetical protein VK179_15175 [Bacteroidales bacterium]|nr:hypothetical protein [Bacteroidales bacterium]